MKVLHSRKVLKPLAIILALLVTSVAVYAAVINANSSQINAGEVLAVTDAISGECKRITNNSSNSYFIPTKTTAEWEAFKSAASRLNVSMIGCLDIVYNKHSSEQCVAAGGTVVGDTLGNKMCKYAAASCPSGWTQYGNWSTTSAGSQSYVNEVDKPTCYATYASNVCGTSVSTCIATGHSWNNASVAVATCAGTEATANWRYKWDDYPCPQDTTTCTGATSVTTTASRTEIGCY